MVTRAYIALLYTSSICHHRALIFTRGCWMLYCRHHVVAESCVWRLLLLMDGTHVCSWILTSSAPPVYLYCIISPQHVLRPAAYYMPQWCVHWMEIGLSAAVPSHVVFALKIRAKWRPYAIGGQSNKAEGQGSGEANLSPLIFRLSGNFLLVGKCSSKNTKFGAENATFLGQIGARLKFLAPISIESEKLQISGVLLGCAYMCSEVVI